MSKCPLPTLFPILLVFTLLAPAAAQQEPKPKRGAEPEVRTATQPATPSTTPSQSTAEEAEIPSEIQQGLVDKVLGFFGLEPPKTSGLQRGHRDIPVPKLDIWVLDLATKELERITHGGGFRSPVFDAEQKHIYALERNKDPLGGKEGNKLVRIELGADTEREPSQIFDTDAAILLLGVANNQVGYLSREGDVWLLDLATGQQRILAGGFDEKHQLLLERGSRRCGEGKGKVVEDHARRQQFGVDSHAVDVLLRADTPNAVAQNLTRDHESRYNLDPAISLDCQEVVMVAGDWD